MRCENSESAATTFLTDRPLRQISEDAEEDDNEGMKECAATRRCQGCFCNRRLIVRRTVPQSLMSVLRMLSQKKLQVCVCLYIMGGMYKCEKVKT